MIDIAKEFGYQIRSFHHAIEAYKIADLLAQEGISASVWADWGGFKMEALDGDQGQRRDRPRRRRARGDPLRRSVRLAAAQPGGGQGDGGGQRGRHPHHAGRSAEVVHGQRGVDARPRRPDRDARDRARTPTSCCGPAARSVSTHAPRTRLDRRRAALRPRAPERNWRTDFELGFVPESWEAAVRTPVVVACRRSACIGRGRASRPSPDRPAPLALAAGVVPASAQTVAITGGKVHPGLRAPDRERDGRHRRRQDRGSRSRRRGPAGRQGDRRDGQVDHAGPVQRDDGARVGRGGHGVLDPTTTARRGNAVSRPPSALGGAEPGRRRCGRRRGTRASPRVRTLPAGGLIAGQGAVVDTRRARPAEMIRKAPAVMVASLASAGAAKTKARGETFDAAARGARGRAGCTSSRGRRSRAPHFARSPRRPPTSPRSAGVLDGKLPLLVEADRATDIEAALTLARDFKLRIVILGGAEAWQVAPQLAAAKVPVFTTALDNIPAIVCQPRHAPGERRAAAQGRCPGGADRRCRRDRSTSATCGSTRATRWPTGCRGTRRCGP